jgi:RNA polymerase sigma-70 factor (ECF subfamily)
LRILDDPDEADAAVQSAFIKACDKLESFKAESQLKTWLYRIAINEALMERRRQTGKNVAFIEDVEVLDSGQMFMADASAHSDPVSAVLNTELHLFIADALDQLPESLRSVIILRGIRGMSTAETAARLDISESAVKVRLHRARQQLKDLLKDSY